MLFFTLSFGLGGYFLASTPLPQEFSEKIKSINKMIFFRVNIVILNEILTIFTKYIRKVSKNIGKFIVVKIQQN